MKLIPLLIGGTYVSYPAFLPTTPKDIEVLLSERECYKAKNTGNKYLLACLPKTGKSLYFFWYDPPSSSSLPVRHLKVGKRTDSSGGATENKKLNLDFTWGNNSTWEIESWIFETISWLKQEEGGENQKELEWDLTTFCKKSEITRIEHHSKKFLKCTWKDNKEKETGEEYWDKFELPPPTPKKIKTPQKDKNERV